MISDDHQTKTPETEDAAAHQEIVKSLVKRFCDTTLKKGISGLREEFARMKDCVVPSPDSLVAFKANNRMLRNRYRDIPCVEETRVKLVDHPNGLDYIHANFVSTPFNERRFICAQGPITTTVFDFWWMVLQEKTEFIVMLCNFFEEGRPKCAQYIPLKTNTFRTFEDIIVVVESVNDMKLDNAGTTEDVTERVLTVKRGKLSHTVTHFHWKSWPDHGVPSNDLAPLVLLQRIRQSQLPIVVHCSAGVGRTGSIVAIEYVLERIIYKEPCDDMAEVLKNLRKQRAQSIQTDLQYLYVHCILLRYYTELKYISAEDENLMQFLEEYDKVVAVSQEAAK
ncbi:hypothetical protein QR680_012333 [Steinernema hermaphroditum]|uniref:Protein-tyrosine phosphatase n=1 Tax=Steinernema hermaphroditum TaxID=289476 RepID=A0AA39I413_9BILA|nr:hypothetical protein QR680_012333 [Steinernema hermaphroditum]